MVFCRNLLFNINWDNFIPSRKTKMSKDDLGSKKWQKFGRYILGFLAIAAVLVWLANAQKSDANFHAYFLDVGQGDAIYIREPNNYDILTDGGQGSQVLSELGEVMPFWDHEISLVIATHPDSDHIAGLVEVLKRYKVDKVLMTDVFRTTNQYQELQDEIKSKNIPVQITKAGDEIIISDQSKVKIFWPEESYQGKNIADTNNTSIVDQINYGDVKFLFTGDAEINTEQMLMQNENTNLKSDILKIGHHGSKNSSSLDFLKLVNPELAIISVSTNNKYGHPHKDTLDKLKELVIKYFRTDEHGRIEVITNGKNFWTK